MAVRTAVALLAEGVDRNLVTVVAQVLAGASPSSRRAWIEILLELPALRAAPVALLAEGVDRNFQPPPWPKKLGGVALLAEGVDRNNPPSGRFC